MHQLRYGMLLGPEARRRREVLDDGAHREVAPQVGAHALVRQRRRRLLRAPPEPLADRAALVGVAVLRDHGVDEQGARDGVAAARRDRLERRLLFLLLRRRRRRRTALVGLALRRGLFILHRSGSEALGAMREFCARGAVRRRPEACRLLGGCSRTSLWDL